jgi:flavin-dependent dehydrogenase
MQLQNDSRVCIIGGGPAGCFAAMHLLTRARQAGLRLDVRIIDPRLGRKGAGILVCKGCAGIVSANALSAIESLGIAIPPAVIQDYIDEYRVHILDQTIRLPQPKPGRKILSVYRGRGPLGHHGDPIESFDAFLLSEAEARGAVFVPERVRAVEWQEGPVIYTASQTLRADLVVMATGINNRPVFDSFFHYTPPPTETMAQDEIPRPREWPSHTVVIFFGGPKGLAFGAMVPKEDYINVSLLGRKMGPNPIGEFYQAQQKAISTYFPESPKGCCGCSPRIPVHSAPVFYGDRWVAVGDAAVARLYKDGIFSGFQTSEWAMQTAIEKGISEQAFQAGYAPPANRIAADNRFGEFLFRVSTSILTNSRLAATFLSVLRSDERRPPEKKILARLIWGMLTGDETYRDLFRLTLQPGELMNLGREILRPRGSRPQE